jgi:hypothetical protein
MVQGIGFGTDETAKAANVDKSGTAEALPEFALTMESATPACCSRTSLSASSAWGSIPTSSPGAEHPRRNGQELWIGFLA